MADLKPRVRKTETLRQRNGRMSSKRLEGSKKSSQGRLKSLAKAVFQPLRFLLWPFKLKFVAKPLRLLGLVLWPRYFRNSFKELRQVKWPDRRQTWRLTFAVLVFALVFGFLVTITDYGLDKVIRRIVLR